MGGHERTHGLCAARCLRGRDQLLRRSFVLHSERPLRTAMGQAPAARRRSRLAPVNRHEPSNGQGLSGRGTGDRARSRRSLHRQPAKHSRAVRAAAKSSSAVSVGDLVFANAYRIIVTGPNKPREAGRTIAVTCCGCASSLPAMTMKGRVIPVETIERR